MEYDADLIEASFAQQYNIRLDCEDITIREYYTMLKGISEDTPLGKIVSIRSEKNRKVIQKMNKQQRHIRTQWHQFLAKKYNHECSGEEKLKQLHQIQEAFQSAFHENN